MRWRPTRQRQSDGGCSRAMMRQGFRSLMRGPVPKAVGSLMLKLRRKAERAGGEFCELNTRALKLSQYDHYTGTCTKKRLSERWHVLGDGSGVVQRDVYSAFLAAIADQNLIHPSRAAAAWPAAQSLLARAGWIREQPVSVAGLLAATSQANPLPAPEPAILRHGKDASRERATLDNLGFSCLRQHLPVGAFREMLTQSASGS